MEIKCDCTVSLAIVFVPNASARQNVVVVATENVGINVSVQFDSPRVSARRGQYVKVPIAIGMFIPMAPPVSPLESEDSDNYCSCSVALPV